jgi:hypothetical protein
VHNRTRLINQAPWLFGGTWYQDRDGPTCISEASLMQLLSGGRHVGSVALYHTDAVGHASELATINGRVDAIDAEIKRLARVDTDMQRLMEIPGVEPTIASALVAAVGTRSSFAKGRDLAAWLGLVPRQGIDMWQGEADRYLEARQSLSSQTVHPRCANGTAPCAGSDFAHSAMGRWFERARAC